MSFSFLFLDLNSFFASVEQAENLSLMNKPLAVVPMIVDTTCCLAASYEAKAFGVKTGTRIKDAKKMCPGIQFIVANHRKYVVYHNKILAAVDKCIPITKVLSIDEMSCELTGRHQIEENAIKKANEIKKSIYENVSPALSCSIGLAPNSYLGKVASDMQKPNGLVLIRKEEIPNIFYPLEIRAFPGIGPRMEKRFFDYGCHTVKELYELSSEQMKSIWGGIIGEEFWQHIRGEILAEKPTRTKTIGHSRVIAPEYRRDRGYIKAICMQLLTKACVRLRDAKLYTNCLHFYAKYMEVNNLDYGGSHPVGQNTGYKNAGYKNEEEKSYWEKKVRFDQTQDTIFLATELEKIFKKLPTGTIIKAGITFSGLFDGKSHQPSLFEDKRSQPLMEAIDKLNKKHNKNLIFPASSNLSDDKTPARIAFSRIPSEKE